VPRAPRVSSVTIVGITKTLSISWLSTTAGGLSAITSTVVRVRGDRELGRDRGVEVAEARLTGTERNGALAAREVDVSPSNWVSAESQNSW